MFINKKNGKMYAELNRVEKLRFSLCYEDSG